MRALLIAMLIAIFTWVVADDRNQWLRDYVGPERTVQGGEE